MHATLKQVNSYTVTHFVCHKCNTVNTIMNTMYEHNEAKFLFGGKFYSTGSYCPTKW